ncbi:RNA 2'-phosphotransferase, partial [Acinetobacter baumannii]
MAFVVANCEKQRFAYNEAGDKIRANQGHSVDVELDLPESCPPETLYPGTVDKWLQSIFEHGLQKMSRHHVHLSADVATA